MKRARVDANQPRIVKALRAAGAKVQHLHMVGQGVPDVLVLYRGRLVLLEIKDGDKPQSAQQLTDAERAWHKEWQDAPLFIVNNEQAALAAIGVTDAGKTAAQGMPEVLPDD